MLVLISLRNLENPFVDWRKFVLAIFFCLLSFLFTGDYALTVAGLVTIYSSYLIIKWLRGIWITRRNVEELIIENAQLYRLLSRCWNIDNTAKKFSTSEINALIAAGRLEEDTVLTRLHYKLCTDVIENEEKKTAGEFQEFESLFSYLASLSPQNLCELNNQTEKE
jgi:hypothetical protein